MQKTIVKFAVGLGAAAVLSGTALASDGEPSKPEPQSQPAPKVHVVQPGDNLSAIAEEE